MKTLMAAGAVALLSTSAAFAGCSGYSHTAKSAGAYAESTPVEPMVNDTVASACDGVEAGDGFVCVEDGTGSIAFVEADQLPMLPGTDALPG